jgi:ribulose-phosphate 3-epimerase
MEKHIIPAIIAATQGEFEDSINRVKDHVSFIQLDFMDGVFVENTSIDFDFALPETECLFEAHLMVDNPSKWVKAYAERVDTVLAPIEVTSNPEAVIDYVKGLGGRVGFVLNPETPLSAVTEYLDRVDQILIMTVHPGAYGAKFLPEALEKVRELRELKPELDIEVDGGITPETIGQAVRAGANMFVSGSYIVKSDDPAAAIGNLRSKLL